MPFGFDDALLLGGAVYGAVKGHGGSSKEDRRRAIAEYRAAHPVGYITPEDLRYRDLLVGRLTEGAQREGELAGYDIGRRFRARGLAGSPSEERSRARLEQEKLLGVQHAGEAGERFLGETRLGREAFEREKASDIFAAEYGGAQREADRQAAEQAMYWNSLMELVPTILHGVDAKPKKAERSEPNPRYVPGYRPEARPSY